MLHNRQAAALIRGRSAPVQALASHSSIKCSIRSRTGLGARAAHHRTRECCCCATSSSLASGLPVAPRPVHVKRMQSVVARFKEGDRGTGVEPAGDVQEDATGQQAQADQEQQQQQQQDMTEASSSGDMAQQREPACEVCGAAGGTAQGRRVPVVFELGKHCTYGNSFAIIGEAPGLGAWDPEHAAAMEWSEGDVWHTSVPLPIDTPIAFKYVELGPQGQLVGWGQDLCAGGNMSVLVEPAQDYVTGFTVTLDPPMPTNPNPTSQPYLVARLDIAAVLPLSSTFFQQKSLAVAAGLPSTKADDLVTDKALAEQGLLTEQQLAAKWGQQDLELLGLTGSEAQAGPDSQAGDGPEGAQAAAGRADGTSAIAGAAAAAAAFGDDAGGDAGGGGVAGGYADAGSLGAAVAGGLMEAGDDETVAGSGGPSSVAAPKPSAAGRMITSIEDYDPSSGSSSSAEDGSSSSKFDISADDEGDWVPAGPPYAAAAVGAAPDTAPPTPARPSQPDTTTAGADSSSSSSARQQDAMQGLTIKPVQLQGAPQTPYSLCKPPPAGSTKLVSAGPSASSIDVDAALGHPGKAVFEVVAGNGLEPLDLVDGAEELQQLGDQPDTTSTPTEADQPAPSGRRVKPNMDQGTSVSMRSEDPLSLPGPPEVAAVRGAESPAGFVDSGDALRPDEGLLVPPELIEPAAAAGAAAARTADVQTRAGAQHEKEGYGSHEALLAPPEQAQAAELAAQAEGLDDAAASMSMDGERQGTAAGSAAARRTADVQTRAGAQHEAEGFGSLEALLAPPEQVQAAGLAARAEGLDKPTATMSIDEERLAAAVAAAAAAASTVRYAGGAAEAPVEEVAAEVDARNALLQGPDATPVLQIMSEAQGIADAAKSGCEAQQQQQSKATQSQQQEQQQQQGHKAGESRGGGRSSKRGGWLKRWIKGE